KSALLTRSQSTPASFLPSYSTSLGHFSEIASSPHNSAAASRTASPASNGTWCGDKCTSAGKTNVTVIDPASDHQELLARPRPAICLPVNTTAGANNFPRRL